MKLVPAVVPLFPVNVQSRPPGEPAKATHLVPFQKYSPGATLFGEAPAVAVFQTVVPDMIEPPCGFTTGASIMVEVNATLGGINPVVDEFISNAPLGVVVPKPTWAKLIEKIDNVINVVIRYFFPIILYLQVIM